MRDIARRRYQNYNWERPFDPIEYSANPQAITMLYESYLQVSSDCEEAQEQISVLQKHVGELDKSNALIKSKLESQQKRKWLPFLLQLIAAVLVGIGVNLVTGNPTNWWGWVFVVVSVLLQTIAFQALRSEI